MIEYVRGSENSIADALSRLDTIAVEHEVLNKLSLGVLFFACFVAGLNRFDARTDWIAKQQSDKIIAFVTGLLKRNARPEQIDVENFQLLKFYSDI